MWKQRLLSILKPVLLIGLLALLIWQFQRSDSSALEELRQRRIDWGRLGLAVVIFVFAEALTFVRWHTLLWALQIPSPLLQTLRLGFIGFLMQFVSLGTVGGDVIKAFLVVSRHPGKLAGAIASIFMDRLVGFLGMLLLASTMFCALATTGKLPPLLQTLAIGSGVGALLGIVIFFIAFWTGWSTLYLLWPFRNVRWLRRVSLRIDEGLSPFRHERRPVLLGVAYSLAAHVLQAIAMFFAARSVFPESPTIAQQLVLWPLAAAAGALPITPAGLGTFELAYANLYDQIQVGDVSHEGLLVAVMFRVLCLITATFGLIFYLTQRSEVAAATKAAREVEEPVGSYP